MNKKDTLKRQRARRGTMKVDEKSKEWATPIDDHLGPRPPLHHPSARLNGTSAVVDTAPNAWGGPSRSSSARLSEFRVYCSPDQISREACAGCLTRLQYTPWMRSPGSIDVRSTRPPWRPAVSARRTLGSVMAREPIARARPISAMLRTGSNAGRRFGASSGPAASCRRRQLDCFGPQLRQGWPLRHKTQATRRQLDIGAAEIAESRCNGECHLCRAEC